MKTNIKHLIDYEKVDILLEGFFKTTGFVTAILDLDGNVLSQSGWRQICTDFHRVHPETTKKCRISDTELANKMAEGKSFHYYQCLNGLVDVAVPIVIKGEHMANLFSGQFFFEKPDESFFRKQAEKYGLDEERYIEALKKVPVVSKEKVQVAMDFLLDVTRLISEMTLQKQEQTELHNELEQKEDTLSKIIMAANDGMWDWDLETNKVYFDPRYYQLSGYDVDEFPHDFAEFQKRIYPDDVDYVMNEAEKHLKGEVDRFDVKFRFMTKSGDWQWIQGKGIIVERNEEGLPRRFVGTHRDISELKQVEEKLKSNYDILRIAGETACFGGWSVDLEKYITYWSDTVADMHEVPHGYLPPVQEALNFYAPEWREKIMQVFTDCVEKGIPYDEEMEIITAKGKRLWVRTNGRAVKDDKGKIIKVQGSFQNITERKQVEKAIKESEEMMRNSQSLAHICSYSTNLNANEIDKSAWVCSPELYKIMGIDKSYPHTIEGWAGFIHPDFREEVFAYHESVVKEKKSFNREYKIIRINDGEERWVHGTGELEFDEKGTPVRMHGAIQDITERKQAEENLKQKQILLRTIVDSIPDAIYVKDTEYRKVLANKADCINTGVKKEEDVIGKTDFDVFPAEIAEKFFKDDQEVVKQGAIVVDREEELIQPNGDKKWLLTTKLPLYNGEGEIIGLVGVGHNITERKQVEDALQQSEEKFRTYFSESPIGIELYDAEGFQTDANKASLSMFGISDITELKAFNLFDGTSLSAENKEILYRGEPVSYQSTFDFDRIKELKQYHSSRSGKAYFDYLITPLWNSDSKSLLGYMLQVQDISERKRAEMIKQLQYNIANATVTSKNINELFDTIIIELNSIIDSKNLVVALYNEETGMFSANMERDEKDKIPVWPAEKSLTGYVIRQNRPVLLRKNEILRLHEEGIIDLIGTTAETWLGVPLKVGDKILGAIVVQNYDNPDVYDQTSIEIMQLAAHELSVFIDWQLSIEKATKLSRAVEQSSVSVMITNREGFIEYVNPFFTEITGYSFEEAKGENPNILKSGHHSSAFYKELWDTILSDNDWEGEILNKKKNGELYWANVIVSPIVNSDGLITNFISIKEDITERKKMVEDLVTAKEKAEESDRLKSAFLANMSHEIRTPMNGILGFTNLLLKPELSSEESARYIKIVHQSGQRMLSTVNDIVEISKIEAGLINVIEKETDINERVKELIQFFRFEAEKKGLNLILEKLLPVENKILMTDQNKLDSILTNLIKNAIKYTDTGTINVGCSLKGMEVEFYVKDTGIGIPKNRHKAVFNRFEQADIEDKSALQGSGLGLAISKSYVEMLDGKIWVESEEGIGSTFYFTLPYNGELIKETAFHQTDISDKTDFVKKLKILIAEDDEVSELLLEEELITVGKEILIAKSGFDAVETCKNNPDIDLVLMDIKMPGMDGYEATRQIRKFNKEVVIIAQTAYGLADDREKSMEAGCNDYISKPIDKTKLQTLIQKYFGNNLM